MYLNTTSCAGLLSKIRLIVTWDVFESEFIKLKLRWYGINSNMRCIWMIIYRLSTSITLRLIVTWDVFEYADISTVDSSFTD